MPANAVIRLFHVLIGEGLECASYLYIHIHGLLEDDANIGPMKRTACCSQLLGLIERNKIEEGCAGLVLLFYCLSCFDEGKSFT